MSAADFEHVADTVAEMFDELEDAEKLLAVERGTTQALAKDKADLNAYAAKCERAIVALAKAAGAYGQVSGPAPGADPTDHARAVDALIAALADPLVVECVAQAAAEADDAEARRDAKMVGP